ncbi:MAG: hypothetical protein WA446_10670 [Steroidobacteraceae bacterium]
MRAGSDLKRAFVAAMLEWIDGGWQLGEFGSHGDVLLHPWDCATHNQYYANWQAILGG